jgi:hypothetical protein
MPWKYEESPDRKHKREWEGAEPGFVRERGDIVGKCPTSITIRSAEMLLNSGVEYSPLRWPHGYPDRIYNIHEGQLYRATPTNPGTSYHGFPEHPTRAQKLPKELKDRILEMARKKNCEAQVRRCLNGK